MSDRLPLTAAESKLNILNKKIVEIRKKIQLSEGQRKANYEEGEIKKYENADKISDLKTQIKELYAEYAKARHDEEGTEGKNKTRCKSSDFKRKGNNLIETIARIDEENVCFRKKIDILKYRFEKRWQTLNLLRREYQELLSGKAQNLFKRKKENPTKKKIVKLEVRLEFMRMMQIKTNIVRRKSKAEYFKLKEQSVFYASSLKELENNINEQEQEIKRLQGVKVEATELKDSAQETLVKEEVEAVNSSNERENVVQEYRKRVAERKLELERLEKMIFSSRRREEYDAVEKNHDQDTKEEIIIDKLTRLEEAFEKLHSVTGVSRTEDVLNRFLGQRATKENLQKMRTTTEQKKMDLERRRQELATEIETRKFAETKNAEQDAVELEDFNRKLEEQFSREKKMIAENERIREVLKEVAETLRDLYDKIQDTSDSNISDDVCTQYDSSKILELLREKVCDTIELLEGQDQSLQALDEVPIEKFDAMSITTTSAEGKSMRHDDSGPLFPRFPTWAISAAPLSEDEDEIPTRNTLKRQAQLLVDAKSRRKGFTFRR